MDDDTVLVHTDAERSTLADLAATFTEEQWETPSLCSGWRVREVVAHLTLGGIGPLEAVVELVRARGSFHRMIDGTARRQASRPTSELVALLRDRVGDRKRPPGTKPIDPLVDLLVHGQDVTRPLGIERAMPLDAARAAADHVWGGDFPHHARRRLHGVRLTATDTDWSVGDGDPVQGTLGDLLLLMTGRHVVVPDLTGSGVSSLSR